jgi:hypothetical protein
MMSNLDRIWKLYMTYKKSESPNGIDRDGWGYYREGYKEAQAQRAALDARRKEKRTQEVTHD